MEEKPKYDSFFIKNLIKIKHWYLNESTLVKATISIVLSAIGGSSIFTLINNYALYYHAYRQGFRIPVEGVEYINLAISLLGICLVILSIVGSWILFYLLYGLNKFINTILKKKSLYLLSIIFVLAISITISIFLKVENEYMNKKRNELINIQIEYNKKEDSLIKGFYDEISNTNYIPKIEDYKIKINFSKDSATHIDFNKYFTKSKSLENLAHRVFIRIKLQTQFNENKQAIKREIATSQSNISIILFIFVILVSLLAFFGLAFYNKKNLKKLVFAIILIFIISTIVLLFNQNFYKSFLGQIGFGGEIPINVEYKQADDTKAIIKGQLLIRTKYSITLRKINTGLIEEIPNERIYRLEYY
ncbi:hypothetical protein [Kordia jejudonensis]|uniref:hypothetical protein n=1 Tax=Kordia jejudonensis TaxID=1348245 RepID=UPI00062915C9|nr:hypothetical protein [Kordia jejudonensis]